MGTLGNVVGYDADRTYDFYLLDDEVKLHVQTYIRMLGRKKSLFLLYAIGSFSLMKDNRYIDITCIDMMFSVFDRLPS